MNKGTLFIISGPSGAGKGTLVSSLLECVEDIELSVSATTRAPRPGEVDGAAYHFFSDEQFDSALDKQDFAEWACVYGNRYGTLASEIDRALAAGKDLILEIDVQGEAQVKERYPDAVSIFVQPPSLEELEQRLRERKTETEASIKRRLETAQVELNCKNRYNVVITNDNLDAAIEKLADVVLGCRAKKVIEETRE
ncbi:MAG: guanylate kinase [Coriobacteriia bacterium]|jgi:guanylate kinase|nr:guanylate kinase [Coriobacteriia bacterium]MDR2714152.1 guanylate kinase [Coriobacteriales bacterium]